MEGESHCILLIFVSDNRRIKLLDELNERVDYSYEAVNIMKGEEASGLDFAVKCSA